MGRKLPPIGKKGYTGAQRINGYIQETMERAKNAKRIEGFKVNREASDSWVLVIRYVVEDEAGNEMLVKERLSGDGDREPLEQLQHRLEDEYLIS